LELRRPSHILPSDRRLKQEIARVGALDDDTPVYRFRYKGSPTMHIGLVAQDVEQTMPEAVATFNGFKMVDYDLATRNARAIAEAVRRACSIGFWPAIGVAC
jgi:hypothetical protein